MKDGIIESWDLMEKYWHQSIYGYLKCDPQEHYFVLTEPPMNPQKIEKTLLKYFSKLLMFLDYISEFELSLLFQDIQKLEKK